MDSIYLDDEGLKLYKESIEAVTVIMNIIVKEAIQYTAEVKAKETKIFESRKISNLFNKKEINKSLQHINDEMEKSAEEFYTTRKRKDDCFEL